MASDIGSIQRSKILNHPLGGGGVGVLRESGLIDTKSRMSKAWSGGLKIRPRWRRANTAVPMEATNLIYDETMQSMIVGFKARDDIIARTEITYLMNKIQDTRPNENWRGPPTQLSSLSLSPSKLLLMTVLDGDCSVYCLDLTNIAEEQYEKPGLRPVMSLIPNVSFWASTANPYSGATRFAIAASNGALILNESQGRWTIESGEWYNNPDAPGPAVIAVDWLSPNVMMKGCVDGGVRLWDIRSRGESRESRIKHPSQINHARRIDENTIVVAGLESQLCTYDLRFPSDLATSGQVTRPFMQFPSYKNLNLGHLSAGFDVYGDLVAAGTSDNRILICDVKRGFKLMEAKQRSTSPTGDTTCMRFANGENDKEGLRLMVAAGMTIDEFAWRV